MGCKTYSIEGSRGESYVLFSEGDDTVGCLCTFPHNDGRRLDAHRVRDLALLGAAVAMLGNGNLENKWVYLPESLPSWIRDEIDRLVPLGDPPDAAPEG